MMSVNEIRERQLMVAEWVDSWRIIPRAMVAGYAYLLIDTVKWYQSLHPYIIKGCTSSTVTDCIAQAPTTQHAAIITAVITLGAAVFGFYTNSGKNWSKGFIPWRTELSPIQVQELEKEDDESSNSSSL